MAAYQNRDAWRRLLLSLTLIVGASSNAACGDDDDDHGDHERDGGDHTQAGKGGDAKDSSTPTPEKDASAPADDAGMGNGQRVELDDGVLEGDLVQGARRFLAIPFAKPPVGPLRFQAPVPNEPWSGVRHETEFVGSCPQLADQGAPASENEDCLYLNVWAPNPQPQKAPVMVWIHGGGNFSGGAGIPIPTTEELWYDGRVFAAERGVVLVTIQYRLGPFGFIAHPGLADEDQPLGNQGLLDQRMALQWVKKNIAEFGGDPGNVTIFGESAGSADVCYHVASPGSWGLFHRAISQSGGCTMRATGREGTPEAVGPKMVAFGEALGCPAGDDQLDCMRDAPVEELLANGMQPMPGAGGVMMAQWSFAAVVDGEDGFLPDSPKALFDRGEIADVPYLLGFNEGEGWTFVVRATPITTEEEYMADLELRFGDDAADVAALYPVSKFDGDYNAARARVIGDSGVSCSTHDTAIRASDAGRKIFMYNFNVPWSIAPTLLHEGHAGEISHVFGTPWLPSPDADSEAVGEAMNKYWARFAETGDPNFSGAPATWPEFSSDDDKRLQLDPNWDVLENFRSEECEYWRARATAE